VKEGLREKGWRKEEGLEYEMETPTPNRIEIKQNKRTRE
jgi:hypothetical protein